MRRAPVAYALTLQLLCAAGAGAFPANPSFEDGDLGGWIAVGNADADGTWRSSAPTDGSYQAIVRTSGSAVVRSIAETALGLTDNTLQILFDDSLGSISTGSGPIEGSAIQQSFDALAGDVLSFDWNFVTREDPSETLTTDFLWQHLSLPDGSSNSGVLAHAAQPASDFFNAQSPSFQQTGYETFSFTLPQDGTYTFSAGVFDVQETNRDSFGVFDNFSVFRAPEPGTAGLLGLGLAVLASRRRTRR